MSRMRAAAEASPRADRGWAHMGPFRRLVGDQSVFPLAYAGLGLAGIAIAIAAARVLGEDFSAFVLVCSVIGAAVGVIRPFYAVLGAILVSPTFGWVVFGPDVSAFQVLVAGAALGCLRLLWADLALARRLLTRPEIVVALLFVGWLSLAALARHDVSDWGFVRNYVGAVVFLGVLALTLRTWRQRAVAVGALLVGVLATALVGLAQVATTDALVSAWVLPDLQVIQDTYNRLGSAWGLANVGSDFGKDVLVGFLLAVPLALNGLRPSLRVPVMIVGGVLAVALVMSGGRSAWLGGIAGLAYIVLVVPGWNLRAAPALFCAGLGLLVLNPSAPVDIQTAVGLAPQSPRGGVIETEPEGGGSSAATRSPRLVVGGVRDEVSTEMSSNLRRRLTVASLEMVRDEPVFGVGAGAFKHYVDRYEPLPEVQERPIDARPNLSAHNVLFELWADSGTPAVLLYVLLIGLVLLRLDRHRREGGDATASMAVGLSAALIGLFATSLFHNYHYDNLLWVMCGIAVSLGLYPPETRIEE